MRLLLLTILVILVATLIGLYIYKQNRRIGVVSMYTWAEGPKYVTEALINMNYTPVVYNIHNTHNIAEIIKKSTIKRWIFTGSKITVTSKGSPQVPMDILSYSDKEFFLICYSMESVLWQMGYKLHERAMNRRENFDLQIDTSRLQERPALMRNLKNPLHLQRNHRWYLTLDPAQPGVVATYENETMMFLYKNTVMTQYHPEKTDDGKRLLLNWIEST
jgi:GMP synthase-like glutamine amidotransferase